MILILKDLRDFSQSIGDGNYLFRLTSLLHCGKSIFHCQTGIMDQVTGFEYLFLLIIRTFIQQTGGIASYSWQVLCKS